MLRRSAVVLSAVSVLFFIGLVAGLPMVCRAEEPVSVTQYLAERAARMAATPADTPPSLGLPEREPMRAAVLDRQQRDDLIIEQVGYLWAERAYVSANVVRSKEATGRLPAIVIAPDWLGHYTQICYKPFVFEMARKGFLVLFIDDPHIGKRQAPYAGLDALGSLTGTSVRSIRVFDALRGLDYLLTRADVDPGRIGLAGLGKGAEAAKLAAALEKRFQYTVPVGGAADFADLGDGVVEWIEQKNKSAVSSDAAPAACGEPEDPDFKMLNYFIRRIAQQAEALPAECASVSDWKTYREGLVEWLAATCNLQSMKPGESVVRSVEEKGELVIESIDLSLDGPIMCPAVLLHATAGPRQGCASIVLSHDRGQCINDTTIADAARALATRGYWVIVPEHASTHTASRRPAVSGPVGFYGPDLSSFYNAADSAELSPLALRVADNLAAYRYLASRKEVDTDRITAAGSGLGGIDACLAALLEPGIAGVAAIDVTTVRDWAEKVTPNLMRCAHTMPYMPGILAKTDLDYCFAALAPRPLLLARVIDGWPESGSNQVTTTATGVYSLYEGSGDAITTLGLRGATKEQEEAMADGVRKQLIAAARSIMPAPPEPGVVGTRQGLKSRQTVDSAAGVVWIVSELGGFPQEFVDGGYRLDTWSFYNDNGAAQQGHLVTPLIFKITDKAYELTGIGKTQTNAGTGLQSFPFEVVQGSDEVAAGYLFGWHTGDLAGNQNPGAVEFEDTPR
ncbi:MAG: hypothetical protein HQ581_05720, partial [Planctomycetes bacterium]|nr:hypothetical protein [Planctomycetota bacterium]